MSALKSTALKNRVLANVPESERDNYVFKLRNKTPKRDGADAMGCSGFITNLATDRHVYVTTDVGSYGSKNLGDLMFRTATDTKDFTGGRNTWHRTDSDDWTEAMLYVIGD